MIMRRPYSRTRHAGQAQVKIRETLDISQAG